MNMNKSEDMWEDVEEYDPQPKWSMNVEVKPVDGDSVLFRWDRTTWISANEMHVYNLMEMR